MTGKRTTDGGRQSFERLAALDAEAAERRARTLSLLSQSREHLRPASLAEETRNWALDYGLDQIARAARAIRAHPVKAAGAAALFGALLGYRPLTRALTAGLVKLLRRWWPEREDDEE